MTEERFSSAEHNLIGAGFLRAQIVKYPAVIGAEVNLEDSIVVDTRTRDHLLGLESGTKNSNSKFIPSRGALGCYLSHFQLWKQIALGGNDAIVAEDDIVFRVSNANSKIQAKWDECKKLGIDLLLLGSSKLPLLPSSSPEIFHVMDHFFGTEGYVISPEAAKRLVENALPIKVQVDAYIGSFASSKKLKIGAIKPSITGQNHMFESTVQPQTIKRKTLHALRKNWLPLLIFVLLLLLSLGLVYTLPKNIKTKD